MYGWKIQIPPFADGDNIPHSSYLLLSKFLPHGKCFFRIIQSLCMYNALYDLGSDSLLYYTIRA